MENKQVHTPSLVLAIVAIVFSIIPIVSFVCGGIALSQCGKVSDQYDTKAAKICAIIGLILGGISFIINIIFVVVGGSMLSLLAY